MNLLTLFLDTAPAGKGGMDWSFLGMMLLIFVVMYFFMIRPQQKRQKEVAKFRNALEKGMKIVTIGGVYGTIKEVKENKVLVEIDNGVSVWFDKAAITKDPSDIGQAR